MKKTGFVPVPVWGAAMLWAACAPIAAAWSASTPVPAALQSSSRADWYRSLIAKGHASERLGQKQDALADYTLAIESHVLTRSDQVQALLDRGLLLDGMGRPSDALADYNATLLLSPNLVAALNNRAGIYARLGRLAEARRDYLSALGVASNSERHFSYFGMGQIAEIQGSFTEAADFYSRSLAVDPHFRLAEERMDALGAYLQRTAPQMTFSEQAPPDQGRREAELQLGAWRSEQNAARGWDHARTVASDVLEGAAPRIVVVDLPGAGRFYRLRVTVAQTGSRGLCGALAAKGLDCFAVHE